MIFGDVEQQRHIGSELIDVIQLKRTYFRHIQSFWVFCNLFCKRITNVSNQSTIQSCLFADMVYQTCRCTLSIASRDGDNGRISLKTIRQFYLTNYLYSLCSNLFYQFIFFWYPRTFHYFICRQNRCFCVSAFFKINPVCY